MLRHATTSWLAVAAAVSLLVTPACKTDTGGCTTNTECGGGQACIDGGCATLCRADNECAATERCDVDHCVTRSGGSGAPPIIQTVNGSGSVDQKDGHMPRHLRDRLLITGFNLADATAELLPESGPPYDLAPCVSPTDTELQVRMPPALAAGRYSLVVANEAGVCDASLQILQGEPGSLNASGSLIVDSINSALATDPALRLRGALPTDELVSFVAARAALALSGSSVVVNGDEQVGTGENADAGLYLVVIDLATHGVVNLSAGAGLTSKGQFLANQGGALRDVLTWADARPELADYVVILASTGDVSGMVNVSGGTTADQLWAQLQRLGASPRVRRLSSTEAYTFIGQKGIGEARGLEVVGGAGRSGVATLATAIVGDGVVGLGNGRDVTSSMVVDGAITSADVANQTLQGEDVKVPFTVGAVTITNSGLGVGSSPTHAMDVSGALYVTGTIHAGGGTEIRACPDTPGCNQASSTCKGQLSVTTQTCSYYASIMFSCSETATSVTCPVVGRLVAP
ncbi:MAG: hypothetical protein HY903_23175 [Deltaproteobacteria bacterium]|nr:hypothetical protein [Deltaproteobacteria bacterium]